MKIAIENIKGDIGFYTLDGHKVNKVIDMARKDKTISCVWSYKKRTDYEFKGAKVLFKRK